MQGPDLARPSASSVGSQYGPLTCCEASGETSVSSQLDGLWKPPMAFRLGKGEPDLDQCAKNPGNGLLGLPLVGNLSSLP